MKGKNASSFADDGGRRRDIEHRICTMRAYLLEAYQRTWNEGIRLSEVDTEVVLDQLDIALERTATSSIRREATNRPTSSPLTNGSGSPPGWSSRSSSLPKPVDGPRRP